MGDMPFRPNPLPPFLAREGGKFGGVLPSPPRSGAGREVNPKTLANLQPTMVGKGGPGGQSPLAVGLGDGPPRTLKRGELSAPVTPPRVGPKTLANPQPTMVGKGGPGGKAPWRGVWGVSPHEFKKGASRPPLQARHEWDQKRWRTLSLRGWEKLKAEGDLPHPLVGAHCKTIERRKYESFRPMAQA